MITLNAKLIEVVQKPYSFNGNEGISYKLRFLTDKDEIMQFKSTKEQTESFKDLVGKHGKMEITLSTRKEEVSVALATFIPKV